jgi:hypothetical protein
MDYLINLRRDKPHFMKGHWFWSFRFNSVSAGCINLERQFVLIANNLETSRHTSEFSILGNFSILKQVKKVALPQQC